MQVILVKRRQTLRDATEVARDERRLVCQHTVIVIVVMSSESRLVALVKATDEDLEAYVGEWLNNLKHGIGKQNYIGQGEYTGYWERGEKHGEGVMKYLNGDIYSG